MASLSIVLLPAILFLVHTAVGQGQYYYSSACGLQLQDIPNPASDSCTAFFRCYQNRQYSVRCPAGQAFHFDRSRCRPANLVDCPLQLQRFQAPGIPHHLRPAGVDEDPRVEIRVIQVGDSNDPNGLLFVDGDGQRVPVTRQFGNRAQTSQSQIRTHPVNPYLRQPVHQSPVATTSNRGDPTITLNGTPIQGQQPPRDNNNYQPPAANVPPQPRPNPNAALPLQ